MYVVPVIRTLPGAGIIMFGKQSAYTAGEPSGWFVAVPQPPL